LTEVPWNLTAKESRGGILEKVAELYRLYRKPHRPTSDTQDEGTADVGWQSLLQSTARQGDDVVYMEFRIFSGVSPPRRDTQDEGTADVGWQSLLQSTARQGDDVVYMEFCIFSGICIGGSLSRSTRMSAESMVVVVGDSEETLYLSTITQDDVLYLSNSHPVFDNLVSTQDDFTVKCAQLYRKPHRPTSDTQDERTADVGWQSLLQSTARQGDDVVCMEFRIFSAKESRGGILEKVAELYRLYRKPHRPTSDTQDEGTADVGWQSLLQSTARQGDDVVYMEFRIFSAKESRGGILEKVAELYRLYRKPHRPTSDTQDEGTADVGWQSLLQSTARQGDDVVYMEFRIFSGVSPPRIFYLFADIFSLCLHSRSSARHFLFHNNINIFISLTLCPYIVLKECIVVCEYSPHLPSTIPSLTVDREGARPALVLACPAGEYSAHLSPSTQCLFLPLLPFKTPLGVFSIVNHTLYVLVLELTDVHFYLFAGFFSVCLHSRSSARHFLFHNNINIFISLTLCLYFLILIYISSILSSIVDTVSIYNFFLSCCLRVVLSPMLCLRLYVIASNTFHNPTSNARDNCRCNSYTRLLVNTSLRR
ncbi:hypothetical protein SFRURICE_020914, partial [Spodoptera frugiperda]